MYNTLLAIHSLTRWLVLCSLLFSVFWAYRGWLRHKRYTKFDNAVRHVTATVAHIQLIWGLWLYFISPIVDYFLHHLSAAMHDRIFRLFGMEHVAMMLLGITVITVGSAKAKHKTSDREKFKNHGHLVYRSPAVNP